MTRFLLMGMKIFGSAAVLLVQVVYLQAFGLESYGHFSLLLLQTTQLGTLMIYPVELRTIEFKDAPPNTIIPRALKTQVLVPVSLLFFTLYFFTNSYFLLLLSGAIAYLEYRKNQSLLRAKNYQLLAASGEWLVRPFAAALLVVLYIQFSLQDPLSIATAAQISISLLAAVIIALSHQHFVSQLKNVPTHHRTKTTNDKPIGRRGREATTRRIIAQYLATASNVVEGFILLPTLALLLDASDFGSLMLLRQIGALVLIFSISNEGRYRYLIQNSQDQGLGLSKIFLEFRLLNLVIGSIVLCAIFITWTSLHLPLIENIDLSVVLIYSKLMLLGCLLGPYHFLVLTQKIDLAPFIANMMTLASNLALIFLFSTVGALNLLVAAGVIGSGFIFRRFIFLIISRHRGNIKW